MFKVYFVVLVCCVGAMHGMFKQLSKPLWAFNSKNKFLHFSSISSSEESKLCEERIKKLKLQITAHIFVRNFLLAGLRLDDAKNIERVEKNAEEAIKKMKVELKQELDLYEKMQKPEK